ncbi:hypothetical protein [Arthrobacter alpinus]|uniref:hypothetical protein n=1 Tax=Arthrobacter alpinus TaxID=656366 RepID=UPI001648E782|nr:hypothetical protein [Arthrobacter alpinus]
MIEEPTPGLTGFMRDIDDVLAKHSKHPDDDWMTQSARGGLEALREQVEDAWIDNRKGLRARFHRGAIVGHTGPANQVLKAMLALNDTVVALVNQSLEKPYKELTDPIKEKLGLWVIPATAGSVVMEMVCPPASELRPRSSKKEISGQTVNPILDTVQVPAERAIDQVLDTLSSLLESSTGNALKVEDHLLKLGGPANAALGRFADRCIELGADVDISDRTDGESPVVLRPIDVRLLRNTITALGLEEEFLTVEGEWLTASDVRMVFDIRTKEYGVLSGAIPRSLAFDSMTALKKFVQVELVVRHKNGDSFAPRYHLKSIHILGSMDPHYFD